MARKRKTPEGGAWVRLLPRPNQASGEHWLLYTNPDGSKPYHPARVHTEEWTPHAAETVEALRADPKLSAFLEFANTNPEETD